MELGPHDTEKKVKVVRRTGEPITFSKIVPHPERALLVVAIFVFSFNIALAFVHANPQVTIVDIIPTQQLTGSAYNAVLSFVENHVPYSR